jgi:hypothetical protein
MKKVYVLSLCILMALHVSGQRNQRRNGSFNQANKQTNNFLHKQWWLGFKAGPNLSKPIVDAPYYVISPTNYDLQEVSKEYESFRSVGSHVAFEVTFYFRKFTLSFQPTYRTNRFVYSNKYEWIDAESPENRLTLNYAQEQKIAYLDWPLLAKYEFRAGNLIPYAQFGVYSSLRLDATKSVTVSGVDYASGGIHKFENEPIIIGASDLFAKYHWGLEAGGGIYYPLGNVRINLDISYRIGMSNIAATENRYASDRLSGVGDSLDDMKLNSLSLSVGCLFPLRFLGSGFKSMVD